MIVQGAFNLLFRAGLRKDFRESYQRHEAQYTRFLRTSSTTEAETQASIITGLSRMVERADGEPVHYEDPKMGPKVIGVDKEFGLGFIISRRTVEDDQYKKANQASKWLAHAAHMTMEYRSASLLDDAFTGNTYKGIDGLPLLHAAHTLIGSDKTFANRPAVDVGLSMTGITAMLDLARQAKDQNGDPIVVNLDKLVIGNNAGDYHRAIQIFGSEKEPFTAENQDNAIKKSIPKMDIVTSAYKQSLKSYFMQDSKLNDAHFVTRRAVDFDDMFDFDTDAAKYKSTCRFMIWFVDPIGWFGSNPL